MLKIRLIWIIESNHFMYIISNNDYIPLFIVQALMELEEEAKGKGFMV